MANQAASLLYGTNIGSPGPVGRKVMASLRSLFAMLQKDSVRHSVEKEPLISTSSSHLQASRKFPWEVILSPLLFILAVEALNVAILEAKDKKLFSGFEVGKDKINVCHLQFTLERNIPFFWWGRLNCVWKNAFHGSLGVYFFSTFKAPKSIISKLESIRRRFFWGGSSDNKKIVGIVLCQKHTRSFMSGGLDIGSLRVSNLSMLAKWWWRFLSEPNHLWCKVIRSIHGAHGGLEELLYQIVMQGMVIASAKLKNDLSKRGIDLHWMVRKERLDIIRPGLHTWAYLCAIDPSVTLWSILYCSGKGRCPVCDEDLKTEEHVLVNCFVAKATWSKEGGGMHGEVGDGFYGGERDDGELVVIGEACVFLLGGGDGGDGGRFGYVVPTGRVVVPTDRYIVPASTVIIIVSTGRLSLVPTGKVLSPGRVK
ncbi:hypothetical protein Tco_1194875 [Tanacetum coccineum]